MMALIDEISKPKRPPPMIEIAAMAYTFPTWYIVSYVVRVRFDLLTREPKLCGSKVGFVA